MIFAVKLTSWCGKGAMNIIPCSSGDSCEGQLCPSEGCRCGCHRRITLGKHPSSLLCAETMEVPRNRYSRQSASSDQIWQHTCLVHHLLSPSVAGLATGETEQPGWMEKTSAARCFCPCPQNLQQARSLSGLWKTHAAKQEPFLKPVKSSGNSKRRPPEGNAANEGLEAGATYSPHWLTTEQTRPSTAAHWKEGYGCLNTAPNSEVYQ